MGIRREISRANPFDICEYPNMLDLQSAALHVCPGDSASTLSQLRKTLDNVEIQVCIIGGYSLTRP
jgi:hypothetical protein